MNFLFKTLILFGIIALVSNSIVAEEKEESNLLSSYLNSEKGILIAENVKLNIAELFKDLLKIADDEEALIACSKEENLKTCIEEKTTEKGRKNQEYRINMMKKGIQTLRSYGNLEENKFIEDLN